MFFSHQKQCRQGQDNQNSNFFNTWGFWFFNVPARRVLPILQDFPIIMFFTNTTRGIVLLVKHLQISVPDFGDSVVAGQTCNRETPGDHNYHNGEHIRSPYDRQKIILRSFEEHLDIIIRLYLDYH